MEAEYAALTPGFGGTGQQRAAVWDAGRLSLGPLHVGVNEAFPAEGSPISQALRRLGAHPDKRGDEFGAVGLSRHRQTEDWIEEARTAGRS